jgi:hypothetical protein
MTACPEYPAGSPANEPFRLTTMSVAPATLYAYGVPDRFEMTRCVLVGSAVTPALVRKSAVELYPTTLAPTTCETNLCVSYYAATPPSTENVPVSKARRTNTLSDMRTP